jgi:hypothetical protein
LDRRDGHGLNFQNCGSVYNEGDKDPSGAGQRVANC